MSKIRIIAAGTVLSGLAGLAAMIPATAASADTTSTTSTTSSTGDALPVIVCVTVEPKSVTVDDVEIGPIAVPTTCITL